eukprot:SAG31_NODE_3371_length_4353_cov_3.023507_5_plen_293_part_00
MDSDPTAVAHGGAAVAVAGAADAASSEDLLLGCCVYRYLFHYQHWSTVVVVQFEDPQRKHPCCGLTILDRESAEARMQAEQLLAWYREAAPVRVSPLLRAYCTVCRALALLVPYQPTMLPRSAQHTQALLPGRWQRVPPMDRVRHGSRQWLSRSMTRLRAGDQTQGVAPPDCAGRQPASVHAAVQLGGTSRPIRRIHLEAKLLRRRIRGRSVPRGAVAQLGAAAAYEGSPPSAAMILLSRNDKISQSISKYLKMSQSISRCLTCVLGRGATNIGRHGQLEPLRNNDIMNNNE